ncbi:hypothetical protein WDW37_19460 [Bdellovibrionota bacterium FG-1]
MLKNSRRIYSWIVLASYLGSIVGGVVPSIAHASGDSMQYDNTKYTPPDVSADCNDICSVLVSTNVNDSWTSASKGSWTENNAPTTVKGLQGVSGANGTWSKADDDWCAAHGSSTSRDAPTAPASPAPLKMGADKVTPDDCGTKKPMLSTDTMGCKQYGDNLLRCNYKNNGQLVSQCAAYKKADEGKTWELILFAMDVATAASCGAVCASSKLGTGAAIGGTLEHLCSWAACGAGLAEVGAAIFLSSDPLKGILGGVGGVEGLNQCANRNKGVPGEKPAPAAPGSNVKKPAVSLQPMYDYRIPVPKPKQIHPFMAALMFGGGSKAFLMGMLGMGEAWGKGKKTPADLIDEAVAKKKAADKAQAEYDTAKSAGKPTKELIPLDIARDKAARDAAAALKAVPKGQKDVATDKMAADKPAAAKPAAPAAAPAPQGDKPAATAASTADKPVPTSDSQKVGEYVDKQTTADNIDPSKVKEKAVANAEAQDLKRQLSDGDKKAAEEALSGARSAKDEGDQKRIKAETKATEDRALKEAETAKGIKEDTAKADAANKEEKESRGTEACLTMAVFGALATYRYINWKNHEDSKNSSCESVKKLYDTGKVKFDANGDPNGGGGGSGGGGGGSTANAGGGSSGNKSAATAAGAAAQAKLESYHSCRDKGLSEGTCSQMAGATDGGILQRSGLDNVAVPAAQQMDLEALNDHLKKSRNAGEAVGGALGGSGEMGAALANLAQAVQDNGAISGLNDLSSSAYSGGGGGGGGGSHGGGGGGSDSGLGGLASLFGGGARTPTAGGGGILSFGAKPDTDIWHAASKDSIFEIVTKRYSTTSERVK